MKYLNYFNVFYISAVIMSIFFLLPLQTLSEEEQQRVLSEEKMGFKKGTGASSPASKKKNSKTKV